jgi:hypothetical protein
MTILRIIAEGDLVAVLWNVFDNDAFLTQLGLLAKPAG